MLTAQRAHNHECRGRIGKLLETGERGSMRLEEPKLRKRRKRGDAEAEATEEQAGGAAQETTTPGQAPTRMEDGAATDSATPGQQRSDNQSGDAAMGQDDRIATDASTKRSAELPAESLRRDTANGYADSDSRVVLLAAAAEAGAAGEASSAGAGSSSGSGVAGPSVPGAQTVSDVGSLRGFDVVSV